jgi:hypothetical protein
VKASDAVGLIRFNRRFGRSRIVAHVGGKIFRCMSLDKHPGVNYTTSWRNLTRKSS